MMATCPTCKTRVGVTIQFTGETHLTARPIGTFSLAGAQAKVSARAYPVALIEHPACGWSQRCYDRGDSYLYPIPDENGAAA
jgi:hypothetical protein